MEPNTAIKAESITPPAAPPRRPSQPLWIQILAPIASLRLTVALFALSLVLVFYGTWAQVETGIWDVVDKYFRSIVAWIPLRVLAFYQLPADWSISNLAIPYPGGWLLGGALLTNLLAAHLVRFKLSWKRSGILILHAGLILMMLGEFFVGVYAVEGIMLIKEGETVNYTQDQRTLELAVVDVTDPTRKEDDIVALYRPAFNKKTISNENLPFDIEIVQFMKNSLIDDRKPGDENFGVDRGMGKNLTVIEKPEESGVDPNSKVDHPSLIAKLKDKTTGESLGTYLLSYYIGMIYDGRGDRVKVGDKTYEISLRPKREYRDFTVFLEKAEERKHPNMQMTKDFSSFIVLNDPKNGVDGREVHIWMNHPMRYRGEAFFQSQMNTLRDGTMQTGLQVVKNEIAGLPFWTLPYISCVVVAFGMLIHFGVVLAGFLDNRTRTATTRIATTTTAGKLFPYFAAMVGIVYLTIGARPNAPHSSGMRIDDFSVIPVQENGRIMPFDTFARTRLMQTLHRQSTLAEVRDEDGKVKRTSTGTIETKRYGATEWALGSMLIGKERMANNPVRDMHFVRIDNDQVLDFLELKNDPQFGFNFRVDQFVNPKFIKEIERIKANGGARKNDMFEAKMVELYHKFQIVGMLAEFQDPKLILPKTAAGTSVSDTPWVPLAEAGAMEAEFDQTSATHVTKLLIFYSMGEADRFNEELNKYYDYLKATDPSLLSRTRLEVFFNRFEPYYHCTVLFVVALVMAVLSWIVWSKPLREGAWALALVALVVYTWTLFVRVQLSGYAPVTNLYSSAVFIGWGCVLLCLGLEYFLRNGVGTVVASATGVIALIIAHNLLEGDSMGKVVAVLESNFWLSTHVICITLGYTATFVAGFLGIMYVFLGMFTNKLRGDPGTMLVKVTYGVIAFAMFLSFVGTVLGGIWADQSWGRFWGWDPKENGALLIVIWNAIILHARWGGMVRSRGVSLLAIAGNVVTAWSWFGTNLLGVGLHSYGFMSGAMLWLVAFAVSQAAIIGLGLVPQTLWQSFRAETAGDDAPKSADVGEPVTAGAK